MGLDILAEHIKFLYQRNKKLSVPDSFHDFNRRFSRAPFIWDRLASPSQWHFNGDGHMGRNVSIGGEGSRLVQCPLDIFEGRSF